ncbi:uncharacterized protein EMH_0093990 [Eimeria mitis]|uniref:Uncharacterized protein n=1 Tax=Eimeria mitis TaxID=44415 RepID=U6KFD4_9EIME|nr:uncharacterized protein EMH_0093990 [Eimeria mitis]CDJ34942.1 hypothetical protein EMH_0093990 [Eimeria mitis]
MDADRWWPGFVQQFQTDYIFPEYVPSPKSRMLNRRVNRLSFALEIYKEGRRPELDEVIELKRDIITHAYKDSQLANPMWKLWIQDDEEFFSSCSDVPSSSGQTSDGLQERGETVSMRAISFVYPAYLQLVVVFSELGAGSKQQRTEKRICLYLLTLSLLPCYSVLGGISNRIEGDGNSGNRSL